MSTDQKEKEYLAPTASGASSAAEQRQTAPAARRLLATAGAARWPLFSSPAGDTPLLAPCPCSFCAWTAGWTSNGGIPVPQEPVLPPTHRQETSPRTRLGAQAGAASCGASVPGDPQSSPQSHPTLAMDHRGPPSHSHGGRGTGTPWHPLCGASLRARAWFLTKVSPQGPPAAAPHGVCPWDSAGAPSIPNRDRGARAGRSAMGGSGPRAPQGICPGLQEPISLRPGRGLLIPGRGLLTAAALSPLGVTVPTKAAAPPLSPIIKNNISATAVSWFG